MFMTVSHWKAESVSDGIIAKAEKIFMPRNADTAAEQAFMVQTGPDSLMAVLQFNDAQTGQNALPQIGSISEAVLVVHMLTEGKIIRTETGATPISL